MCTILPFSYHATAAAKGENEITLRPKRGKLPSFDRKKMLPFVTLRMGNNAKVAAPLRTKPEDDRKEASGACILPRVALSSPPLMPKAASARDRRRSPVRASGLFCLTLALVAVFIVFAVPGSTTRGNAVATRTRTAAKPSSPAREAPSIVSPLTSAALSSSSSSSSTSPPSSRHQHQGPERLLRRRPPPSTNAVVVEASLSLAAFPGSSSRPDAEFPPAVPRSPLLSTAELLTLQHYARGSSYVEWGSGASTLLAAPMARRAVSIENQRAWCDDMLASSDVDFWIENGVLTYLCVDTGPTGELGMPRAEANPEHFRRYLSALDDAADTVTAKEEAETEAGAETEAEAEAAEAKAETLTFSSSMARFLRAPGIHGGKVSTVSFSTTKGSNSNKDNDSNDSPSTTTTSSSNAFTVVLVDGRFRIACALKALWHIDHSLGVLLVHDWTLRREQYHAPILKRYRLVTVIDRMALLVPSSPPAEGLVSGHGVGDGKDQGQQARARWWYEAAAELERYSRDPA